MPPQNTARKVKPLLSVAKNKTPGSLSVKGETNKSVEKTISRIEEWRVESYASQHYGPARYATNRQDSGNKQSACV